MEITWHKFMFALHHWLDRRYLWCQPWHSYSSFFCLVLSNFIPQWSEQCTSYYKSVQSGPALGLTLCRDMFEFTWVHQDLQQSMLRPQSSHSVFFLLTYWLMKSTQIPLLQRYLFSENVNLAWFMYNQVMWSFLISHNWFDSLLCISSSLILIPHVVLCLISNWALPAIQLKTTTTTTTKGKKTY